MSADAAESAASSWSAATRRAAPDDPLLDCLVLLAKIEHRPLSAEALSAGLPVDERGFTPELFVRAAARSGLSARVTSRPLSRISNLVLPAVLLLKDRQACVLLGLDEQAKSARILQPDSGAGEVDVGLAELGERYAGSAIFVRAEYRFDARTPEVLGKRSEHWFWGTLLGSWRIYRDVLVASLLVNLFALVSPLFVMNVYDRVVPNNAVETLWVLATGVSIVYLFDLVMRGLRGYFVDIASKKADVVLSSMIFEKVMGLRMDARPASVGAFANNLHEFESIRDFITSATILTLVDLPFVALFVFVIWFIGGPIAIIPACGIAVVAVAALALQVPLRNAVQKTFRTSAQKNATLVESLTAVETVKTLGAEGALQRKWEQAVGHIATWGVRSRLLSSSVVTLAVFVQQMAGVAVVVLGVYLIRDAELSMGGLIACVILAGRAMAPTASVANLATRYNQCAAALKTLNGIMQLPVERAPGKTFVRRPVLDGGIEFQNVSFAYPEQPTESLSHVSFAMAPGEKVGIIGRIGSGKTTIEKLVLGLYEPSSGGVRVDGVDVRQIDPADLRRNIGYIPQDILLFYGTVRDNIVLGHPHVDDSAILEAAEISGVSEFVNRHPLGFDMPVGERGEGLSGGQRQSIAIARALLMNPPILVMDEPSNSMDNSSEEWLKTQLTEYLHGKSLLLVTHRASLLDLVDRLIVIDHGRIVADGPKDQVRSALKQGKLHVARR